MLAPDAVDLLTRYPWPGNVRELKNVMERAVLLAKGPQIRAADLPLHLPAPGTTERSGMPAISLAELERRHIESVLHETSWHQGRAATALGISSKTLYRKIREYGFRRPGGVE
jgi:DNA-binding NtrC family response regulator